MHRDDLIRVEVMGPSLWRYTCRNQRHPVYKQLLEDYSHTRIERNRPYTTLVFIALALGRLNDRGDVIYGWGPATGYWSYNGEISYWALPPGPASPDERITWKQYALEHGLDSEA